MTHLSESSTAHDWHTTLPQPPGKSSDHREGPSRSSHSDSCDDSAPADRRLLLGDELLVIASRARKSSTSISSKLSDRWSRSRRNVGLGDGVAEKQRSGVGGVDTAPSVQVRAHIEQVSQLTWHKAH
ncbi:hypothetical protein FRC08_004048 [Ceratobasidium sp. 394]|nr:hypothetical protein FRC08_004048 [Ceratobasidium sp. 394]